MMKTKYMLVFLLGMLLGFWHTSVYAQDLVQIYQLALESDTVLKQAEANRMAIGENEDQAIAKLLPTLGLSANSAWNRLTNTKSRPTFQGAGTQEYWDNGFTLNLTQPVFHWDYWVELTQADNQIAQAEALYQDEVQSLMVRVSEAYFNILAAEESLAFTQAEKEAIEQQLEQAEQRFNVGLIAMTDVYEARAAFDKAVADLIRMQNELDNNKERLREIIGPVEFNLLALNAHLPLNSPEPNNSDEWGKIAENQNLKVLAALNDAEVSRKAIELQQSGHYPTVDIVGAYTLTDNNSSFGLRGDQERIGVQLNLPLFAGGMVNSRTRQAQYRYVQAKEKLNGVRRAVDRQVKDAYRGVISSIGQVNALQASVTSMQNALEATEAGLEVGTRTMVDVLKNQSDLYEAKRNYARARYDYLINGLKLKQSASVVNVQDVAAINQLIKH
ncbi:MAG: TolC family outer membrane protein [Methylobacter sp.]|nr:TolC family outer membrane protein [Methylobacter sp.]MDP2429735.1 TolC family outer membrane protein [Methylobacter sp.]MDP3054343.1 TolC family outer membrane protein [Methylobacter sp.]MDP3361009.1 TolC family outer membrane protein [Methylobacter sp.]